jgi:sphinganine-1-phosphate aldolase
MGFSSCIKHYVREIIAIVPLTDDQKKLIAVYTREVIEQVNE